MAKLPRELISTGSSVAVRGGLRPGAVAHRADTVSRKNVGRTLGSNQPLQVSVPVPACDPKGPPAALFSAAWADHKGADACTEAGCFPDA